jgi:hypothetical protein
MALWQLDAFKAPQFLGFVRAAFEADPPSFRGQEVLPFRTVEDIAFEYILGADRRQAMATVLSWDSEAPIASRQGAGEKVIGELPPIKRKSRIGEKEIVRFRQPRANSRDVDLAIEQVFNDTLDLIAAVRARTEWMAIQALSETNLIYDEDGVKFAFDYGVRGIFQWSVPGLVDNATRDGAASNTVLTLGGPWNNPTTATYVNDLTKFCDYIEITTGSRPTRFYCSLTAANYFVHSTEIKGLVRGTAAGTTTIRLRPEEVRSVFDEYRLPQIIPYDAVVYREEKDGSTTAVRPLAINKAFLLQDQNPGEFLVGPTAESRSLPYTLAASAPGIWANTYATDEPPAEWQKVAAAAFPTIPEMNRVGQMTLW